MKIWVGMGWTMISIETSAASVGRLLFAWEYIRQELDYPSEAYKIAFQDSFGPSLHHTLAHWRKNVWTEA
jgi:hypothetical protein